MDKKGEKFLNDKKIPIANKILNSIFKMEKKWDKMEEDIKDKGYGWLEINKMNLYMAFITNAVKELEKVIKHMQQQLKSDKWYDENESESE